MNETVNQNESWSTVFESYLGQKEDGSLFDHSQVVEVELHNALLHENVKIILSPDCSSEELGNSILKQLRNAYPLLLYVVSQNVLNCTVGKIYYLFIFSFYLKLRCI